MQCPIFNVTLSPEKCIKRQEIAKQGYVTKQILYNDGNSREYQTEMPVSFKLCKNCTTGKLVKLFPNRYIRKDFTMLVTEQLKILKERGYVFKTEMDLICLMIAEKNEKLTNADRIELIDHIARISKNLAIERRLNGKQHKVLSATGCRIARYLRKQRNQERDKPTVTTSIGS
jgi:hypothetical protein